MCYGFTIHYTPSVCNIPSVSSSSRKMASLLFACALRAGNVPKKDDWWKWGGTSSDPWVRIEAGGSSCESNYVSNTESPVWNKCCSFNCAASPCPVKFTVYDADFYGDEEIGSVEHSAESLSTGKSPKL